MNNEQEQQKPVEEKKENFLKQFNKMALVSMAIGLVIIIMGFVVIGKNVSVNTHYAHSYDVDYAAFGADFYTEIYGASDVIVSALDDINGGIGQISQSMAVLANVVQYPIGMLIIALGLGVIAVSCNNLKKNN